METLLLALNMQYLVYNSKVLSNCSLPVAPSNEVKPNLSASSLFINWQTTLCQDFSDHLTAQTNTSFQSDVNKLVARSGVYKSVGGTYTFLYRQKGRKWNILAACILYCFGHCQKMCHTCRKFVYFPCLIILADCCVSWLWCHSV